MHNEETRIGINKK